MLMDIRPKTVLFAALLAGTLPLSATALAQSDAVQEGQAAMEEKAAESMPGEGMMEDDPELMEGSDAMKQSREAMSDHQGEGGGEMETDPDLLEGGSDAAREQREKMMDMEDDAAQ